MATKRQNLNANSRHDSSAKEAHVPTTFALLALAAALAVATNNSYGVSMATCLHRLSAASSGVIASVDSNHVCYHQKYIAVEGTCLKRTSVVIRYTVIEREVAMLLPALPIQVLFHCTAFSVDQMDGYKQRSKHIERSACYPTYPQSPVEKQQIVESRQTT